MLRVSSAVAVCAFLTGALGAVGCSSSESPAPSEDCLQTAAAALKTCAKGSTLTGVDVSYYQGNVNWASVKGSGRHFAFVRISDGLNHPDTKFAQNWPAVRAAEEKKRVFQSA